MPSRRSRRPDALPRGQAGRVAERVRALLAESEPAYTSGSEFGGLGSFEDGDTHVDDVIDGMGDDELDYGDDEGVVGPVHGGRAAARPHGWDRPGLWDKLAARVPVRLDPGRRAALAVGVAVLIAAIVTGVWLVSSRPAAVPVSASVARVPGSAPLVGTDGATVGAGAVSSSTASSGSASGSASASSVRLVVDVAGKVRRPGVYRLPAGSRVDDAITAAGGPVGHVDLSTLNLAAPLTDGEQVAVGVPAAAGAPVAAGGGTAGGDSAGSGGTLVDLNTATIDQLETLPGVGPVLGQNILDYRASNGSFRSVQQLEDVSGIGDVKFAELKSLVTV